MANFHRAMNKLEHRRCVTCKEAWPTNNGLILQIFECLRCKRDKGNPKLFSQENDMDPGCLPTALQGLTDHAMMVILSMNSVQKVWLLWHFQLFSLTEKVIPLRKGCAKNASCGVASCEVRVAVASCELQLRVASCEL